MFLAIVLPIGGGSPTHPIAPGGQPPGIWGGAPPQVGYPLPQPPPGVWPNPPSQPPGVWPSPPVGVWPNPPGGGGHPSHPIAPGGSTPPWGIPIIPGVWPSPPGGGHPSHPIAPGGGDGESSGWGWAYSPVYGWVIVPGGGGGKPQPPGGEPPVATPT